MNAKRRQSPFLGPTFFFCSRRTRLVQGNGWKVALFRPDFCLQEIELNKFIPSQFGYFRIPKLNLISALIRVHFGLLRGGVREGVVSHFMKWFDARDS